MSPEPIRTPGVFAVDPAESRLQTAHVRADDDPEATLRPRRLDEFVGQEALREQLGVSIQAAAKRGEALDHVLLAGPPESTASAIFGPTDCTPSSSRNRSRSSSVAKP